MSLFFVVPMRSSTIDSFNLSFGAWFFTFYSCGTYLRTYFTYLWLVTPTYFFLPWGDKSPKRPLFENVILAFIFFESSLNFENIVCCLSNTSRRCLRLCLPPSKYLRTENIIRLLKGFPSMKSERGSKNKAAWVWWAHVVQSLKRFAVFSSNYLRFALASHFHFYLSPICSRLCNHRAKMVSTPSWESS